MTFTLFWCIKWAAHLPCVEGVFETVLRKAVCTITFLLSFILWSVDANHSGLSENRVRVMAYCQPP